MSEKGTGCRYPNWKCRTW